MDAKVANNGYIPFSQHESKWEVFCHTDKRNCCSITSVGGALGNWFYPNGSEVLTYTQFQNNAGARDHPIFATRRDKGFVHLYRTENSQYNPGLNGSELRGTFHCVVPDQQDNNQTIYINVCKPMCYGVAIELLLIESYAHKHAIFPMHTQWTFQVR